MKENTKMVWRDVAKAVSKLTKLDKSWILLWLCCLVCGVGLMTLIQGGGFVLSVPLERSQEMSDKLVRLREENQTLYDKVTQLERRTREYQEAVAGNGAAEDAMRADLREAQLEAGLLAAKGPGVVVEIRNIVTSYGPIKHVTDADLLLVINELNAGGAEAISINGERLIANTEIRNAGNHISINTNQHSVPFIITAIGNPETLHAAMTLYGGVIDSLGELYEITLSKSDDLAVPRYNGVLAFNYATPLQELP